MRQSTDLSGLLRTEPKAQTDFTFIDPPFSRNHPNVSTYPAEVTGRFILASMCRRLGWPSLKDRKLLDFGCGVRMTQTIVNLGMDVGLYAGVDTDRGVVDWLRQTVADDRFRFEHINMRNPMYNSEGIMPAANALTDLGLRDFGAMCMFSVITHNAPDEAAAIFSMAREAVANDGRLYFTAFIDESLDGYAEGDPANPRLLSTYAPALLIEVLNDCGWLVSDVYPSTPFQQTVFLCGKKSAV